jgi:GNAT superfamily N-acetyltransferase
VDIRLAERSDLDGLTELFAEAFSADPVWGGWAFPGGEGLDAWWRFFISSCLRHRATWIAGDLEAAAVWNPPGTDELSREDEERVEPLLRELVGPRAGDVLALLEAFGAVRPNEPHAYLSLLGVAGHARGRGLGMALLAENLSALDTDGVPAYLESTNPANDARYERAGFRRHGRFTTPDGAAQVTTMWRDPR